MKTVIKFRMELFRKKFSLYGFSNIIVFLLLTSVLLFLPRFVIYKIENHYMLVVALITSIFCCLVIEFIIKRQPEKDISFVRIYFDKIDINQYKKYITYYRYWIYQFIYIWLCIPVYVENIRDFSLVLMAFEVFVTAELIIYRYFGIQLFNIVRQGSSILVLAFSILISRKMIYFPFAELDARRNVYIEIVIILISIFISMKNIGLDVKLQNSGILDKFCKFKIISSNKDYIYIMRRNKFVEPIFVIIFSCSLSIAMTEESFDILITYLALYSYLFYYYYIELIKYETKSYVLLYQHDELKCMKTQKIRSTITIVFCTFVIFMIPLILFVKSYFVIIAYVIAMVLFIINSMITKFSFEKRKGYKQAITDREQLKYIMLFCLEIIVIGIMLEIIRG